MHCVECDAVLETAAETCPHCDSNPLLAGRYQLDRTLGRGAHGTVYAATDRHTQQKLAIKELPLRHDMDPTQHALFLREAAVLQQLKHPAIPSFFGQEIAGRGKGRALYLIQAFIEGQTLKEHLTTHRYTEAEVTTVIEEVLDVLNYLHTLSPPVIHRDIKPSNIIRRPDGRLVLIDFGTVRDALQDPDLGGNTVAGTFGYMAPEQFSGNASPATDYYGLGVTALALLSRKEPTTLLDHSGRLQWKQVVDLSPAMTALLEGLLETNPRQRIQSPQAVEETLTRPTPPLLHSPERTPNPLHELNEPDQPLMHRPTAGAQRSNTVVRTSIAAVFLFSMAVFFMVLSTTQSSPPPTPPTPVELPTSTPAPSPIFSPTLPPVPEQHQQRVDIQLGPEDSARAQTYQASHPVVPRVPAAELKQANITESTCTMIYDIAPDGSTSVRGAVDSPDCIDAGYRNAWQALSATRYPPADSERLGKMRIVYRLSDPQQRQ